MSNICPNCLVYPLHDDETPDDCAVCEHETAAAEAAEHAREAAEAR